MRGETDKSKLMQFMENLGRQVQGAGRVYITGGGTAILYGWREMTIDVDIKAEPEPAGFFEAIAVLKNQLDINVELASPDQFLPPLPEWQKRSIFIQRFSEIDFYHYDLYSQVLSKLERGHARDLKDVEAIASKKLVEPDKLWALFLEIENGLIRYPAVDAASLRGKIANHCGKTGK